MVENFDRVAVAIRKPSLAASTRVEAAQGLWPMAFKS
jgi:hypothetical protein